MCDGNIVGKKEGQILKMKSFRAHVESEKKMKLDESGGSTKHEGSAGSRKTRCAW